MIDVKAIMARGRFCRRLSIAGLPECRLPLGHEGAHITAYVETEELMDRCATMLREQGAASVARDDAEERRLDRLAREDRDDPWTILAGVRAENDALRAQGRALTGERDSWRDRVNVAEAESTRYADNLVIMRDRLTTAESQRDAALADLRDARALAFRALTRITPLSGSQRIMVLGWEKYESAFAFGADGSGK